MFDTWTCHICGKERPDAQISVYSSTTYINESKLVSMRQNVRYCNDNPECIEGAKTFSFMKEK